MNELVKEYVEAIQELKYGYQIGFISDEALEYCIQRNVKNLNELGYNISADALISRIS